MLTFVRSKYYITTKKLKEMYLTTEKKQEIFEKYGKSNTDTGSPEAQIALFSYRISHLTEHLKSNHKDYTTQRALKMLVGKRRRLLDYLIRTDINRYRAIIAQKELGIRK
jgi:small subunit ribosomal protein S15